MIDDYISDKSKYIGMIKIIVFHGGCNDINVYKPDEPEIYSQLIDINHLKQKSKVDPSYNIDEFETDKYYLWNCQIQRHYLYNNICIFLKKPLTAVVCAKLIKYFDKVSTLDMREYTPNACYVLYLMLKNRGFIATDYDEKLIKRFIVNREEVADYEKYDITADELRDLFD